MKLLQSAFTLPFAVAFAVLNPSARAEVTITAVESGGNVVFTVSGAVDTNGKYNAGNFAAQTVLNPKLGDIEIWPTETVADQIDLQAAVPFGDGSDMQDVGVGSGVGFAIFNAKLYLPST